MAYKQGKGGTYMIDWRREPIGRIQKASGTTDDATFKEVLAMLEALFKTGKHDLLREIQDNTIKPLAALELYRAGALDTAITVKKDLPIFKAVTKYLDEAKELAPVTVKNYRHLLKTFEARFPEKHLHELPKLLAKYRADCIRRDENKRVFDLTRSLFQGFLNNSPGFGKNSALWKAVSDIKPIKAKAESVHPLDVKEYRKLRAALTRDSFRGMLDTLVFTGMRKGEYYTHHYETISDRILVHGTKNDTSDRIIPRWITPTRASVFQKFEEDLRILGPKVIGKPVFPHALRHTFASWMERANIPKSRRDIYMGHKAGRDVSSIYTWSDVEEFREEDYRTFLNWYRKTIEEIANPPAPVERVDLSTI